ncbi:MAG: GntR family transcriptional regulator [Ruminococcus sp.]|nr:GntR family transcriptional regulator [Ruminococcus sp.]
MAWSFDKHTPVYLQIAERIRNNIIRGVYPPNSQIPSVRQLALLAAVNPNTVQHALTALELEGIIYSESTTGRFVTDNEELINSARVQAAHKLVSQFMKSAQELSISKDELITMIKEENE